VDSSEIWYGEDASEGPDHALVVTDIDREAGIAILSDPGQPEGDGFTVPLDEFEDAWADGGNSMIVADEPAPEGISVETISVGPEVAQDTTATVGEPDVAGDGTSLAFTPLGDEQPVELHTRLPEAISFVTERPWILLPIAIGAGRLIAR
jgi:hypothetical protein